MNDFLRDHNIKFKVALKTIPQEGNLVYEYNPFFNYRLNEDMFFYKNKFWTLYELAWELTPLSDNEKYEIIADDSGEETRKEYSKEEQDERVWNKLVRLIDTTYNPSEEEKDTSSDNEDDTSNEETKSSEEEEEDENEENSSDKEDELNSKYDWYKVVPKSETIPILYQKGQLTDFVTDELLFDLNHPVTLTPSYSYDNSVDLVINDGKNPPRLINSRFSATERNLYIVNDRNGNNDTNIYDKGIQFDIDTSLYKKITTIPKLRLLNIEYGGNLSIGNYNFYFKYIDDDGNESDFFAESALILIFIGSDLFSCYSGFRDENAHKIITFLLTDLDEAYLKIKVYFTRATSDIYLNITINSYYINTPYVINSNSSKISITGFENVTEISVEKINEQLLRYQAVETQAVCLNILFFAHNYKIKLNYLELKDLALRFLPYCDINTTYTSLSSSYNGSITNTYYNPIFTYKKTGYWSDIYRFGIVFIYSDLTLSDVYNTRGGWIKDLNIPYNYSSIDVIDNKTKERIYINYDLNTYQIISDNLGDIPLENVKGVVKFPNNVPLNKILGVTFKTDIDTIKYLQKLGIIGYFIVRLKRIPTILCLAYTIGIDNLSNLPVMANSSDSGNIETFLNKDQILTHDDSKRFYNVKKSLIRKEGAICPEYDVNYPYFNSLFTGENFIIEPYSNVYYSCNEPINSSNITPTGDFYTTRIIGLEDNVKLVAIGDHKFSARAGEAEEAFRYEYIGKENKVSEATNLTRGSYGPYLGIVGYNEMGKIVNIRIPGYNENEMESYFKIRYEDSYPYYAISDRIKLEDIIFEESVITDTCYRGDCFICNYTHRLNRNFQDPSAPTNDKIVDPKCWKENYEIEDDVLKIENFEKINLGDVNAIKMGRYINLIIKSNINLNIRALDDSNTDEVALFGHPRTFTPYNMNPLDGSYKIPEALCYNKGMEKSLSEKYYFGLPDTPFLNEDFTNRISYSNIKVTNNFQNGHRTFQGTHYRDYSKEYGSIIKLEEWNGNLLCVCEHGVLLIAVNERAIAAEGAQGLAYINTSNVLPENPKVISDKFGSLWRESIIKTPHYVYGVDTIARKIWRTDGNQMEYISDLRITEFLNNNISLTERELTPIIGVRNVKSHYNAFKLDVMFTFYDNLYGFEEKVWNICFNEKLGKWITFYSWVPSYSENIYNSLFSFDRNTSKWIAKLGTSHVDNSFADGVVLTNNIINNYTKENDETPSTFIGYLDLANRTLPTGENVYNTITYSLERDNYGNYKYFEIKEVNGTEDEESYNKLIEKYKKLYNKETLSIKVYGLFINSEGTKKKISYDELCSELYIRTSEIDSNGKGTDKIYPYSDPFKNKILNPEWNDNLKVFKDDSLKRVNLESSNSNGEDERKNPDKIVRLLNIKAEIKTSYTGQNVELKDAYNGSSDILTIDAGYYLSVVAVIPKYNMLFLSTDFWRHGQAGIIDIADKIYPTYWYGKQHPFEFEFVVAEHPEAHKIFDNLLIISNKAEPESFHYEIVGECYDFAKDKKNMYIRQEATKELYQYNGSDITFDSQYKDLDNTPREIEGNDNLYDKSTIFPLYYRRDDTINEVEDSYHSFEGKDYNGNNPNTKDFANLSGAEIVRYKNLDEYRIWQHSKGININDLKEGNLRQGNMIYKEDIWNILINPLEIIQRNEYKEEWDNVYREENSDSKLLVPAELNLFKDTTPKFTHDYKDENGETVLGLPENWTRNIISWKDYQTKYSQAKIKDKWIKIRIRYSGKDLAIISAIRTLYSISFA